VDLIHPASRGELAGALRAASAGRRRVQIVGGRTHMDRTAQREVDAELWTTQLDRTVAYDPAEMIAVVEAGMRVGELDRILREGGQEWPVDAPQQATVGGVIAAGVSSLRRLRVGHVRDTVAELDLVTGDGRAVRSGARTVKNVTGFDIHRLATGSYGSLGAIVQMALKVRPLPQSRRTLVHTGDGGLEMGRELLRAVPAAAAILAGPDRIELRLEGWTVEVEELTAAANAVADDLYVLEDDAFPARRVDDAPTVVEAAVPPSRTAQLVEGFSEWSALIGVGLVWVRFAGSDDPALGTIHDRAAAAGGMSRLIRGTAPAGAPPAAPLPASEVHRRLKHAFDPAGILAPLPGSDGP
jgi:glycolate dehydrogenase FAD-binding subunit